jgi:hypothetical protein
MHLVSLDRSVVGIYSRKLDFFTEIRRAFGTKKAFPTRYAWLDSDTVP